MTDRRTDAWLRRFLELYYYNPAMALSRAPEAAYLVSREMAPPVLDLGCGDGIFAREIFASPLEVGTDFIPRRARKAAASGAYRFTLSSDARQLPFADASFGTVISNCVVEHIPDIGDVFKEVQRVLRPGGEFRLTTTLRLFGEQMWWARMLRRIGAPHAAARHVDRVLGGLAVANRYTREQWQADLEAAGLEVVDVGFYLPRRAERIFWKLTAFSDFGLGKFTIHRFTKWGGKTLGKLGLPCVRRAGVGLFLNWWLRRYTLDGNDGCCILITARKS